MMSTGGSADKAVLADAIGSAQVITVLRSTSYANPRDTTSALVDLGFPIVEFTLTGSNALDAIQQASAVPDAVVGVGTVLTRADAAAAVSAGARFVVSPIADSRIVLPSVPTMLAGFTPTELTRAALATDWLVKVFPAGVGGPEMVAHLLQPLPELRLVVSGGVTSANVVEYLNAGAYAVATGAFCPSQALANGDLDVITRGAREFAQALQGQ